MYVERVSLEEEIAAATAKEKKEAKERMQMKVPGKEGYL